MNIVELDSAEVQQAQLLARATFARYQRVGVQYENTFNTHFIGKLDELAVSKYPTERGIKHKCHFLDLQSDQLADIELSDGRRIDVRAWSLHHWPELGRCLAQDQAERMAKKADCIVWCSVVSKVSNASGLLAVKIEGCNPVEQVISFPSAETGPSGKKEECNHQVPIDVLCPLSIRHEWFVLNSELCPSVQYLRFVLAEAKSTAKTTNGRYCERRSWLRLRERSPMVSPRQGESIRPCAGQR